MDSFVVLGALGSGTGCGRFSALEKSGENVVKKYARLATSSSERVGQAGIDVYGMPRLMMFTRS
jgi:hypothetical protein